MALLKKYCLNFVPSADYTGLVRTFALTVISVIVVLCVFSMDVQASGSQTGKITGQVVDAETGDLLPSINISVEGTNKGASTNFRGEFNIIGIPSGRYSIKASAIGFKSVRVTEVWISSGLETVVNIQMPPAPIELDEVVVVSSPSYDVGKNSTGTVHIVSESEISRLPAENILDLLSILPGISSNSIVRGSRTSEIDFQIDGLSIRDPLFGSMPSGALLNNLSLKEIQIFTGGFSANFGNAMSGIVNLVTRDGGDRWTGDLRLKNSFSALNGKNDGYKLNSRGERIVEFAGGGPVKYAGKGFNLFVSGRVNTQQNRSPGLEVYDPVGNNITDYAHNQLNQASLFGKATFKIGNDTKITLAGFHGNHNHEEDVWFWKYHQGSVGLPSVSQKDNAAYLRFSHTLTKNVLIEASFDYMRQKYTRGIKDELDSYSWAESYNMITEFESENPIVFGRQNPYGVQGLFVNRGFLDAYWSTKAEYYAANVNTIWQISDYANLKLGGSARKYDLSNFYRGNSYEEPLYQQDNYAYQPLDYSAFAVTSLNFYRFRLDAGFRMYYINLKAGTDDETLAADETPSDVDPQMRISPRLGLSIELPKGIRAHANFGTYYQPTTFHSLYAGTRNDSDIYSNQIDGNPHLSFQWANNYEAGFTFYLSDFISLDITGYTKQLDDLEDLRLMQEGLTFFPQFSNRGRSSVNGIELTLSKMRTEWIGFQMAYNYAVAKGTLTFPEPEIDPKASNEVSIRQDDIALSRSYASSAEYEYNLPFDMRHNLRAIADIHIPEGRGFSYKGFIPFQNLSASMTFNMESGTPYTKQRLNGEYVGEYNGERHPWYFNSDMRIRKKLGGFGIPLSMFVDIRNVFNFTRARYHYPATGSPDSPGLIEQTYPLKDDYEVPDIDDTLLYNPVADLNSDGLIDQHEQQEAYNRFLADFNLLKSLYQKPREIWLGIQFHF